MNVELLLMTYASVKSKEGQERNDESGDDYGYFNDC